MEVMVMLFLSAENYSETVVEEILRFGWEFVKENPVLAVLIFLLLALVGIGLICSVIILLGKIGFTIEGFQFKPRPSDGKIPPLITMPDPFQNIDTDNLSLPKEIEDFLEQLNKKRSGSCCIKCESRKDAKYLSCVFFKRIEKVKWLDHYGWISYSKKKDDQDLSIMSCMVRQIYTIGSHIEKRDDRFYHQLRYFQKKRRRTLLIINMAEQPVEKDDQLSQLAGLPGLNIVIFSNKPVDGYLIKEVGRR